MIIENVFHKMEYKTARLFYCIDASLLFGVSKILFYFKKNEYLYSATMHLIDQKYHV